MATEASTAPQRHYESSFTIASRCSTIRYIFALVCCRVLYVRWVLQSRYDYVESREESETTAAGIRKITRVSQTAINNDEIERIAE